MQTNQKVILAIGNGWWLFFQNARKKTNGRKKIIPPTPRIVRINGEIELIWNLEARDG